MNSSGNTVIMGAGLAGLTAAQRLSEAGHRLTLIESAKDVGGLARTVQHGGFRFDLGGHRFVTDNPQLEQFVCQLLGNDCLTVPRSSQILLRNRYFDYPLKPLNALFGFGPLTSASILFDYARERLRARLIKQRPVSLEDWVVQHFGRSMFNLYFREYSEKVWGIDCRQIDMRWVEQRIQGLSLGKAIKKALWPGSTKRLPTLSRHFLYPRYGIGQITDELGRQVQRYNPIYTGRRITRVNHSHGRIQCVEVTDGTQSSTILADQFISTIPLPALICAMRPHPPADVLAAASRLRSRDLVTVSIMLNRERITDHTWIYIPEQTIPFGRIHEPTNWSRRMAPAGQSLLVIEYFCFRGDSTWSSSDDRLVHQTVAQLDKLGLIQAHEVIDSVVTRIVNAYPLFEVGYVDHCQVIYDYLNRFDNLHTAGRGGMFRYYNMDHAMQAGMDAAQTIIQNSTSMPVTGVYA